MMLKLAVLIVVTSFAASACNKPPANPSSSEEPAATEEAALSEKEPAEPEPAEPETAEAPDDFAGRLTPEAILDADAGWAKAFKSSSPDAQAAAELAEVEPGAEVVVYLGVWCGDSRREVPRFWKALELAGEVPFDVRYVGVNRSFDAGEVSLEGVELEAVPTFVVSRDGAEVGRVVETSPGGIEHDVLSLLRGEKSGVISASR